MAWRPPRTLWVYGQPVEVRQVPQDVLKDLAADHDDEALDGVWRHDTATIYLDRALSSRQKNIAFWHEVGHMLVDLAPPSAP